MCCGLGGERRKPPVPDCEERPGAAHSRRDQDCLAVGDGCGGCVHWRVPAALPPRAADLGARGRYTIGYFVLERRSSCASRGARRTSSRIVFVLRRVLLLSRNHPVFLTRPSCGHLIPHTHTIVPSPLMLHLVWFSGFNLHVVFLHLYTFFRESITAFVFSSHAHPMARHMPSAILSHKKGHSHPLPHLPGHNTRSCVVLDPRLIFLSFQSE